MYKFITYFIQAFLKQIAEDMGLKGSAGTKSKLVYAIATQTPLKALETSRESFQEKFYEEALSSLKQKKAPAIKKGVSYQDLFQWYPLPDLVEYCRENELKVSGTKPEVIKRILAFLDGDIENTKATNKSTKTASKEKAESKEKSAEKTTKKVSKNSAKETKA
jgi:hypothetical protein